MVDVAVIVFGELVVVFVEKVVDVFVLVLMLVANYEMVADVRVIVVDVVNERIVVVVLWKSGRCDCTGCCGCRCPEKLVDYVVIVVVVVRIVFVVV